MSDRIPIFGNKRLNRWRSNFAAAPFEVKVLFLITAAAAIVPYSFTLTDGDNSDIAWGLIIPAGGLFFIQSFMASIRLAFGDQSPINQIKNRLVIIVMLSSIILFSKIYTIPYFIIHKSPRISKQVFLYRPLYDTLLPSLLIFVVLVRLVPLVIKHLKLKRQDRLAKAVS